MSSSSPVTSNGDTSGNYEVHPTAMEAPDSPPEYLPPNAGGVAGRETGGTSQPNTGSRVTGDAKNHFGAPGSSWQTKKYSEEYERLESTLVDRQWNSTQYGDTLAPR